MDGRELAAWQRRCGIRTQKRAARMLRLSKSQYRERLKDRLPVDERTELLCAFWEHHLDTFVEHVEVQAQASLKLASLTDTPIAGITAQRAIKVLSRLTKTLNNGNGNGNGRR